MKRLICWLLGHRMIEDPGMDDTLEGRRIPLYYAGFRPYCERCNLDVDDLR